MEVPEVKRLKSLEEETPDSRSCLPKPCWIKSASGGSWAKVLTTDQKREAVMLMCDATGLSQRRACRLTGLSLSTCRYEAHRPAADAHLSGRITELALERRRLATVFGSCCAVKGFMLIISACTGFITSVAGRKRRRRRKGWQQNVCRCSVRRRPI